MVNIKCDNKQCSKWNASGFCDVNSILHIGSSGVCNFYIKELARKKNIINLVGDTTDFKEVEEKKEEQK